MAFSLQHGLHQCSGASCGLHTTVSFYASFHFTTAPVTRHLLRLPLLAECRSSSTSTCCRFRFPHTTMFPNGLPVDILVPPPPRPPTGEHLSVEGLDNDIRSDDDDSEQAASIVSSDSDNSDSDFPPSPTRKYKRHKFLWIDRDDDRDHQQQTPVSLGRVCRSPRMGRCARNLQVLQPRVRLHCTRQSERQCKQALSDIPHGVCLREQVGLRVAVPCCNLVRPKRCC